MPELKPCPFCGSSSNLNWTRHSYVCCDNCDAFGPSSEYPMSAISEWNTRAEPSSDLVSALIAEAVKKERERCATLMTECAENEMAASKKYRSGSNPWFAHIQKAEIYRECAAEIRADVGASE